VIAKGKHRNLIPFRPGQSGNPTGRPRGARNKLGEEVLADLYEDFAMHGAAAIERVRQKDPATYLRVIASLVPKEVKSASDPFDGLTGEELQLLAAAARAALGRGSSAH
jgi:hypothetical protein